MKRLIVIFSLVLIGSSASARHRARQSTAHKEDFQSRLSATAPPKDMEVCFSPDEPCDAKLVQFVRSAQTRIDVAIYDINQEQLLHQLLLKAKNLPVRILVDKRQSEGVHSSVGMLVKAGANVRYGHQRGIMHNKFMIVDGKMVETGSYNYTHHATLANNENQIYLSSPAVVARYEGRFNKIWHEGKPVADMRAPATRPTASSEEGE